MKALLLKCSLGLFLLSIALTACRKSENMEKSGSIINYYVLFSQMGGQGVVYNIRFNNDTILYQIHNDLRPFGISTATKFPVKVTVSSKPDGTGSDWITITALKISN